MKQTLSICLRLAAAVGLGAGLLLLAACDDDAQPGGVGPAVGLPPTLTFDRTAVPDTGVGSVHWVGNPRW